MGLPLMMEGEGVVFIAVRISPDVLMCHGYWLEGLCTSCGSLALK